MVSSFSNLLHIFEEKIALSFVFLFMVFNMYYLKIILVVLGSLYEWMKSAMVSTTPRLPKIKTPKLNNKSKKPEIKTVNRDSVSNV